MTGLLLGLLLALAVVLWPTGARHRWTRWARWDVGPASPGARPGPRASRSAMPVPLPRQGRREGVTGVSRRRRGLAADAELLVVLELLGPALRAGLPVTTALEGPGSGTALGAALAAAGRAGRPLAPVWGAWARATGSAGGRVVERVWWLGERLGSPLAEAVEDAAEGVRADAERRRRVAAAVAGPRATAQLLTLLPVAGPGLSMVLGLRPDELWGGVGGPLALGGALLVLAGHLWCRALLRTVTRPRRVGS